MFDIAWSEMIVIGAVALIAIGPKDLPKALRAVGAMTAKARRMASEFQDHFREAMREAELESVKEEVANINRDLSAATSGIQSEFNSIGSQMPAPSQPPLQLSGEATELDIPGLPELPVKAGDAATPPAGEPAAASGSPSSPDTTAHQAASAQPKAAEPAPAVTVSAQAQPGSVTVTETAVGETTAEPESKKPARKKRVVKPKPNGETQAEMPLEAAASNGSRPADAQASPDEPSAKPARTKTPRKRAAKALPSGDDAAKALPSGDDQAA